MVTQAWYLVPAMKELLALIRKHEGGARGYNADYRNDDRWPVTTNTFTQVRAWGRSQVTPQGEASSAIGGYQFLTATLDWLKTDLKLTGSEIMSEPFQDDLAVHLINAKRTPGALGRFARGSLSINQFADLVAKEWASMPVLYGQQGSSRWVSRGQSYYAGDGLNAALTSAATVEAVLGRLQKELAASVNAPMPAPILLILEKGDGITSTDAATIAAVREAQTLLKAAGFSPGVIDGKFGSVTEAKVIAFQRSRGLKQDGIIGPATWAALRSTNPSVAVMGVGEPEEEKSMAMQKEVEVPVKSSWASKINIGALIAGLAGPAAFFGLDIPVETLAAAETMLVSGFAIYTWVMRTWFTKSVTKATAERLKL